MRKRSLLFLFGLAVIAISIAAQPDINRRKARYYFTQGALEAAQKNVAEAYEYFKKAYELDPTYDEAAFTYGSQRLFVHTDTLQTDQELLRSLGMMQNYVDLHPKDLYATQMYGFVTTRLDTVEEAIRVYERTYGLMPKETQILLNLADSYLMLRKGKEALDRLEKYEVIEGKSPSLSLKKINCYLADQDTVGAVAEVEALIKNNPHDPYGRLLKGNLYEVLGEMDSVYVAYKEAELLSPESGNVKMSLANYYREVGDSVMLDNMMYEALLSEDFEIEEKISILADYLQKLIDEKGEKSRGDYLFSVLMAQYPHEPELLDMFARYSAAKGEYGKAAEEIGYAIDLDATNERYWLMLMSYLLADSRYEDIVSAYEKSLKNIEPSLSMKNLYSGAASQLEDTDKGKEILESLLKETNSELIGGDKETLNKIRRSISYDELTWISSLYCMLGDLYFKTGEKDKAFESYEISLYFMPDNVLTLNNYAYFLAESDQDLEKALTMSRRSLDLSDKNPTYFDTYAWILYKLGNYSEALEYQKMAIDMSLEQGDENEEYEYHLKMIEKALDDKENAQDSL